MLSDYSWCKSAVFHVPILPVHIAFTPLPLIKHWWGEPLQFPFNQESLTTVSCTDRCALQRLMAELLQSPHCVLYRGAQNWTQYSRCDLSSADWGKDQCSPPNLPSFASLAFPLCVLMPFGRQRSRDLGTNSVLCCRAVRAVLPNKPHLALLSLCREQAACMQSLFAAT